jgi:hypothetical protein
VAVSFIGGRNQSKIILIIYYDQMFTSSVKASIKVKDTISLGMDYVIFIFIISHWLIEIVVSIDTRFL